MCAFVRSSASFTGSSSITLQKAFAEFIPATGSDIHILIWTLLAFLEESTPVNGGKPIACERRQTFSREQACLWLVLRNIACFFKGNKKAMPINRQKAALQQHSLRQGRQGENDH